MGNHLSLDRCAVFLYRRDRHFESNPENNFRFIQHVGLSVDLDRLHGCLSLGHACLHLPEDIVDPAQHINARILDSLQRGDGLRLDIVSKVLQGLNRVAKLQKLVHDARREADNDRAEVVHVTDRLVHVREEFVYDPAEPLHAAVHKTLSQILVLQRPRVCTQSQAFGAKLVNNFVFESSKFVLIAEGDERDKVDFNDGAEEVSHLERYPCCRLAEALETHDAVAGVRRDGRQDPHRLN